MLGKKQLATVVYAMRYLVANYDEAILWDEKPEEVSELFKDNTPLTEYELTKLADSLTGLELKVYQLEVSGNLSSFDSKKSLVSARVWLSPEEALAHQEEFLDKVCNPEQRLDSLLRESVKIRVIELDIS